MKSHRSRIKAVMTSLMAVALVLSFATTGMAYPGPSVTYTVTFDANGGSPSPDSQSVASGGYLTWPSPEPIRPGYELTGWRRTSASSNWDFSGYDADRVYGNYSLEARWTSRSNVRVEFESNGGSAVADAWVQYNGLVTKPADPTRTGYRFVGWYDDSALTDAWSFATDRVTAGERLHAKWQRVWNVSFVSNGGSAVGAQVVDSGQAATEPAEPTRYGYEFAGWRSDSGLTTPFVFATPITANTVLYADWDAIYHDVYFDADGGSPEPASQSVQHGELVTEPAEPSRPGYLFLGWEQAEMLPSEIFFTGFEPTYWDFDEDIVEEDVYLVADWEAIEYEASFVSNGGSAVAAQSPLFFGDNVVKPADPTRTGYTFAGWFANEALTVPWDFAEDTIDDDVTLYAKWTIKSFTVTLDPSLGAVTVPFGGTVAKPADPVRSGYVFGGWFSDPALTTPWNFSSGTVTGDTTIYAKWTKVSSPVTAVSNPVTGDDVAALVGLGALVAVAGLGVFGFRRRRA